MSVQAERQAGRQADRQTDSAVQLIALSLGAVSPGRGGSPLPGLVGPAAAVLRWFGQLQEKKKQKKIKHAKSSRLAQQS